MEQAAAEAQAAATREFVGVREAREATLKGLQQEYSDAVDAQALQSGEKLQRHASSMLSRSLTAIEKSEARAQRLIEPAVRRMLAIKGDVASAPCWGWDARVRG